jgi:signal transduction histidine kinase
VILRTQQLKAEKEKVELTLDELKATQEQLILKEKMASLGEMTTGIAHEIQNPLNFVNNFSELNKELIQELKGGLETGSVQSVQEILTDLDSNTERVYFHGKRADQIVKSMLQFTRGGRGQKKPTDIVALADECIWRAFDAFKNKNNCFDASVNMDLKTEVGHHNLVPNDISRVLMNLYDNAFYAVHEKKILSACNCTSFEPVVTVAAREEEGNLIISIIDNGSGIPDKFKDKIFQPFFTTKPTGHGTGLGLSLCYDIIKAHGGEIKVESQEGVGSAFFVIIPVSKD